MEYDVAIIGAGVTGCFIAKELSKYDLSVVVIEKEPTQGVGQTKGCSGIIHAFQLPFSSLKGKLCLEGNRMMDEEAKELGFRFRRVGLILLSSNLLSKIALKLARIYLSRYVEVRYLTKEELKRIEKNISKKINGGLFFPSAGVVNPIEMTFMARKFAEENGVEFKFERRVVGIKKNDTSYEILAENNGRKEVFKSRIVVNCAGLYADDIAKMVGHDLTIVPGKGSHVVFDDGDFSKHLIAILPLPPDRRTKGGGSLVTIDGNIIWGPNLIETGDKEDRSVTREEVNAIIRKHSRAFETIPKKPVEVYAGVRSIAGRDFIIDCKEGFINVAGIQSPGLTSAPAIAKFVVEMIGKRMKMSRKGSVKRYRLSLPKSGKLVCYCREVYDSDIEIVLRSGGRTLDDIKHLTGATMSCKKCLPEIVEFMVNMGLRVRKDYSNSDVVWKEGNG
jgi:glycerol-3-phosphate dehydrogenase